MSAVGRSEALWWTAFLALVGLALAIVWIPIGFSGSPGPELWSYYHVLDHGADWFEWPPSYSGRLVERLPVAIGRWLDPSSFAGLHVALLVLLGAKPLLAAAVLRRLGCDRAGSAAGGLLLLFFPGDDALLIPRFIAYHFAIVLILLAVCLWLAVAERPRRMLALAPLFWSLCAASLLSVEALLPFALIVPLLLLLRRPAAPRRQWWPAAAGWLVAPVAVVLWYASWLGPSSYQASLIRDEALAERLGAGAVALATTVGHLLVGAWLEAARGAIAAPALDLAAAALLGVLAGAFIGMPDRDPAPAAPSGSRAAVLAIAILLLGYAPFAFLPSHRGAALRIYLAAMLGAAPLLVLFFRAVARRAGPRRREVFAAAAGLLFACGGAAALEAQRALVARARFEQQVLSDIVSAAPQPPHNAAILLHDPHRLLEHEYLFGWKVTDGHFCDIVRFLYRRLDLSIGSWKAGKRIGGTAEVVPGEHAVAVKTRWGRGLVDVPYDRLAFFELGADGRARLRPLPAEFPASASAAYAPRAWSGAAARPARAAEFLPLAAPGVPLELETRDRGGASAQELGEDGRSRQR